MKGLIDRLLRPLCCFFWVLLFFFGFWMILSVGRVMTNLVHSDYHEMFRSVAVAGITFGISAILFFMLIMINDRPQ